MELRELRAFVAVADHGGVARAASALYLSASTVSHAVTTLEAEVGARLFHRLARGMTLTDAGQTMLGPARRALQEVAAMEAAATAADGEVTGRITIVPGRIFLSPVIDLVARFHAANPSVVVSLREPDNGPVIAELVRTGAADFGVMSEESLPRDLDATPMGTQTHALLVPAGHALAARESVSYEDLDGVEFIGPPPTSPFRPMFEERCRAAGSTPRVVAETDHLQTMLELVRAGVGATIATLESAARSPGDEVAVVLLDPHDVRPMSLVCRAKTPRTPAAEAFWHFAGTHEDRPPN
jgi:DNA-binding transcriptional LysR family regulator